MGCGSCGTGANGAPKGCKSNGHCATGGCNRMNAFDWLSALPLADSRPFPIIEMTFSSGSRKEFYRNNTNYILEKGDCLAVEGMGGFDIGQVNLTGELVKLQLKKYGVKENEVTKRVLHPALPEELDEFRKHKAREAEILIRSRAIARNLNLDMKLCEVEIQADGKKGTFFYTADQRVDFRELIKLFAGDFKMKIEMRQIGARQESGKVGGIGSCGRELCCSTWLSDFKSVNTSAARYQNLSINQTKLSGQCGRLKCCLNYELDTYMDALSVFPDHAENLETVKGIAHLQKRDIFKNLMFYSFSDNNKQYPLAITRVKEILLLNKQGQKVDDLQPVELETRETAGSPKGDVGFVNDIGQTTLKSLEKSKKKKKPGNRQEDNAGKPQDGENRNRPQSRQDDRQGKPQEGENRNRQQGRPDDRQGKPQEGENRNRQQQGRQDDRQGKPQEGENRNRQQQGKPQEQGNKQQQQGGNKPQQQQRNEQPKPPRQQDENAPKQQGGAEQGNKNRGQQQGGKPRNEGQPQRQNGGRDRVRQEGQQEQKQEGGEQVDPKPVADGGQQGNRQQRPGNQQRQRPERDRRPQNNANKEQPQQPTPPTGDTTE